MKTLMLILITIASCAAFAPTLLAQDINLAALSADDVKAIRKIIADRDYEKARADEAVSQAESWKVSAGSWRVLYLAEKDRADRVQGGRVEELLKANAAYKAQAENDRERLGELEFKVRKLKSQRKWWFAAGAAGGLAGGLKIGSITF